MLIVICYIINIVFFPYIRTRAYRGDHSLTSLWLTSLHSLSLSLVGSAKRVRWRGGTQDGIRGYGSEGLHFETKFRERGRREEGGGGSKRLTRVVVVCGGV